MRISDWSSDVCSSGLILAVPAASATTATAATSTLAFLMLGRAAALDLRLDLFIEFFFGDVLFLFNDRRVSYDIRRTRTARFNRHPRAFGFPIRQDGDLHTVTRFDLINLGALVVEDIESRFLAGAQRDETAAPPRSEEHTSELHSSH